MNGWKIALHLAATFIQSNIQLRQDTTEQLKCCSRTQTWQLGSAGDLNSKPSVAQRQRWGTYFKKVIHYLLLITLSVLYVNYKLITLSEK